MKYEKKLTVVFVLALMIVSGIGVQSYMLVQQMTEKNRWVIHTHEVHEGLENILSALKDIETSGRGFVLTGEDIFLAPYNTAIKELPKDIDYVTTLTRDNPQQQASIQLLNKLSREKLDIVGQFINQRRIGGLKAALPVILSNNGRRTMDEIRVLINQMITREDQLLEKRTHAVNKATQWSFWLIALGMLFSLLVIGFAALITINSIKLIDRDIRSQSMGRKWLGLVIRYGFTVAIVALIIWLRWWLVGSFGPMPLFITFYPGVLLVTAIAGGGQGIVATILTALATDYWFIEPIGQFNILNTNDAIAMGIFTCTSIFLSLLIEYYRQAQRKSMEEIQVVNIYNRSLLEASLDPLVTISADGKVTDVNEATIKVTGVRRELLIGSDFSNYFTEPQKAKEGYQQVFDKGIVIDYPLTIRHKDGRLTDVLYNASVYKDGNGNVIGVFAAARDVTVQKQASQYARSLLEASLDPLVTIAADGKITDVNEATIKATGRTRAELIGTDYSSYFTDPEKAQTGYRLVFAKGFVTDFPLTIHHKDGRLMDVLYNATIYKDTRGNVAGIFAAARDVTLLNQAEAELKNHRDSLEVLVKERTAKLEALNRELAQSNENLEQFAYVASHDLQEPLRILSNFSQLLEKRYKDKLDQDANDFIGFIVDGAKRMKVLISDLLTYSRAGRNEQTAKEIDFNKIVGKVIYYMSPIIEQSEGKVTCDKLPVLVAREIHIMQLFQNLISNALKYHSDKAPGIHIRAKRNNDVWLFSVSDNGIGIDPRFHEKIFQIFQRLHSKEEYSGTGIGLSICKKIVSNYGGKIWVESEEGKGSTFYFTIAA